MTSEAAAIDAVREHDDRVPAVALILGSGLGALGDELDNATGIPFRDIPGFPAAAVAGHAGRLLLGELAGVTCVTLQGRFHLYEGHDAATVALPTRVMLGLGARALIVTNAAGGINPGFETGDVMVIEDHINLMGRNPLVGPVREGETRFPDMTTPYDPGLRELAVEVAAADGLRLVRGVYAAVLGPSYETPAEIRMLAALGADAVGMSTVPEVIVARARGVPVLGLSLISNAAAGLSPVPLTHDEVVAAGLEAGQRFGRLLRGILRGLPGALAEGAS
ncbi:MAG TPA: purine-nucleoside phosphorylase [Longimicrobiales bacterium]|nr:purine-nucleoside phosphorylase [Longimicrobiales bacterium]